MLNERDIRKVKRRVAAKKGFGVHFMIWAAFTVFFFVLNVATGDNEIWFIYPSMSWGLGLFIHYLAVFGFPFMNRLERKWEEEEIIRQYRKKESEFADYGADRAELPYPEEESLVLPELEKKYKDSDFV